jgi:NADPH2:quinone reductase
MPRFVRAARLTAHGAPLRVEEVALREPGPSEVVVELAAAGVNPVDRYGAEGRVAPDGPVPRTLGGEGAGWLDGVPVAVASGGGLGSMTDGTWAEAVVIERDKLIALDSAVDLPAAAALGVAGVTAYKTVVEVGQVTSSDRALVLGAAGGVGLAIVSLAISAGARVLGQAGSAGKAEVVRAFGAEALVADADSLAAAARDFQPTIVFDPLGAGFTPAALSILAPYGRHVIFGTSAGSQSELALQPIYRASQRILGYGGLGLSAAERHAGAEAACAALTEGRLRIHVGEVIALSEVAGVFDALTDRSLAGKLVIDCTR